MPAILHFLLPSGTSSPSTILSCSIFSSSSGKTDAHAEAANSTSPGNIILQNPFMTETDQLM